ncbi:MerR family DNA-binding transcriptional regulator [Ornithinimicrobium humiphilum]|uniref:DNA-binding transcriptional MerR regulator n=1 Tax=Ornithinimicrobium humiphilum TaxID=125288 RepID=A0A543KQL1_9MICO|nr:MerR family DNA-binding transcriptional regulator [Ornithinimicrobium humiphilum]TQM97369.1 DNA-binding transcriptional MerR regulator [Ornithinimicrobium humiphilum]
MTDVPRLLSIGELSRASGISVSALRFYDRTGVLAPADVEPATGYRRYLPSQVAQARLLAGMRRVQMPVAEMAAALEAVRTGDVGTADDLLTAHLDRLETGLQQARAQVAQLRAAVADGTPPLPEDAPVAGVPAATLLANLAAVRHAVSTDPDLPALQGVLVEVGDGLTLVATDRYRMVVAGPWRRSSINTTPGSVLLPAEEADRLASWLRGRDCSLEVSVEDDHLVVSADDDELRLTGMDEPYPDYRAVLDHGGADRPVDGAALQAALAGTDRLVDLDGLTVDRDYLWQAVGAVPDGRVMLPAEGVLAPLVVRSPDEDDVLALVMPVLRQEQP